jgi:hypothetical protein
VFAEFKLKSLTGWINVIITACLASSERGRTPGTRPFKDDTEYTDKNHINYLILDLVE